MKDEVILIKETSPFEEDSSRLIGELDRYQEELYPAESNHLDSRGVLSQENCKFIAAYKADEICGIAAVKFMQGYGEIKRMYVPAEFRGSGIAEGLISTLEKCLIEKGITKSRLETGIYQKEALSFYNRVGYQEIDAFADYKEDEFSCFMQKKLEGFSRGVCKNFYIVCFTSQLRDKSDAYADITNEMESLVREQDGFLGVLSTRNAAGVGLTASCWSDLSSMNEWKIQPRHAKAQELGKTQFYSKYKIHKFKIEMA